MPVKKKRSSAPHKVPSRHTVKTNKRPAKSPPREPTMAEPTMAEPSIEQIVKDAAAKESELYGDHWLDAVEYGRLGRRLYFDTGMTPPKVVAPGQADRTILGGWPSWGHSMSQQEAYARYAEVKARITAARVAKKLDEKFWKDLIGLGTASVKIGFDPAERKVGKEHELGMGYVQMVGRAHRTGKTEDMFIQMLKSGGAKGRWALGDKTWHSDMPDFLFTSKQWSELSVAAQKSLYREKLRTLEFGLTDLVTADTIRARMKVIHEKRQAGQRRIKAARDTAKMVARINTPTEDVRAKVGAKLKAMVAKHEGPYGRCATTTPMTTAVGRTPDKVVATDTATEAALRARAVKILNDRNSNRTTSRWATEAEVREMMTELHWYDKNADAVKPVMFPSKFQAAAPGSHKKSYWYAFAWVIVVLTALTLYAMAVQHAGVLK